MSKVKTQTVIALSKLQLNFIAPMADVPNLDGFRLLAVLPNRLALPLRVCKDSVTGCHYLADQNHTHRLPSAFLGWLRDESFLSK